MGGGNRLQGSRGSLDRISPGLHPDRQVSINSVEAAVSSLYVLIPSVYPTEL
jgi:hypothetical protein